MGYDASAHATEETKKADIGGVWGMKIVEKQPEIRQSDCFSTVCRKILSTKPQCRNSDDEIPAVDIPFYPEDMYDFPAQ
ncbi:unnamed protein product [Didymodactylos carnosus]|uniref:Uncharacterized protein n=1 Tax=Didymodactylos carnosus TaxID=1234261 RepID=A0A815XHA1_9BILA|nr:unnamed protein product [Didymodactylos carnosus]CAF4419071.1 unnamed protein product [Didymodactylos carnosus]